MPQCLPFYFYFSSQKPSWGLVTSPQDFCQGLHESANLRPSLLQSIVWPDYTPQNSFVHIAPGSHTWTKFQIFILVSKVVFNVAPAYHSGLSTESLPKSISPSLAKVVLLAPNSPCSFQTLPLLKESPDWQALPGSHSPHSPSKYFPILLKTPDTLKAKLLLHPNTGVIPRSFFHHVMVSIVSCLSYIKIM